MANSNSKKINMNKKQIEKTLGKKNNTSANAKKGNSNNKNKKPLNNNKPVTKPEEVKTNVVNNTNKNVEKVKTEPKKTVPTPKVVEKKEAVKAVVNKKDTEKKQPVKTTKPKPKKKIDKKDKFKVNPDGSLYDLSSIYPKKKQDKKKKPEVAETPSGFKETFFEELTEKEEQVKKQETKKNFKKFFIIVAILAVLALVGTFGYKKYKQFVKSRLRVYDEYKLGSELKAQDGSTWYVVEYSDKGNPKVKLLNHGVIDVNGDGKIDENDKMRFSTDSDKYDKTDATGIAYFLLNNYKGVLESKLGFAIDDIDLLTSKEYVRLRDYLGYGYEWDVANILGNYDMGYYWINSESDKMYAVSPRGSYKMTSKDNLYFVRCVITVSKDNLKLLVDNEE